MPSKEVTQADIERVGQQALPIGASPEFAALTEQSTRVEEITGAYPLVDKERLEGIPFLVLDYSELQSDVADEPYVNVKIMLPNGARVSFNDGGVGIKPVLEAHWFEADDNGMLSKRADVQPLYCPRGLKLSRYTTEVNGREINAATYYFG